MTKKAFSRYFLVTVIAMIVIFLCTFLVLTRHANEKWDKRREVLFTNPQPGTCFVFRFKEDLNEINSFSIGKVESVEGNKLRLSYSRRSHWEEGLAMGNAEVCAKNPTKCKLPQVQDITLKELRSMGIGYVFVPEK